VAKRHRMTNVLPCALTIAGSDPSGGAGIQADLKTFTVLGVYGASVITACTAQNTLGVSGVHVLPAAFVREQLDRVAEDLPVAATKTGMLATADIIEVVAAGLREWHLERVVVDPVMVSTSGHSLLDPDAVEAMRRELLPLALVLTPNLPEAAALLGEAVADPLEAARRLAELGPAFVVVKGGHGEGAEAVDVLYERATGRYEAFASPRLDTPHTHGSGCTFAAAITTSLAEGCDVWEAVARAKRFVTAAIAAAGPMGRGHGPLNHIAGGRALCD
jgi:hydroxymethylpyrimidine/phosphomethylpyrimidine kinase